ncbi:class F sortase [Dactylosporangium darangshiense]|uniref:class F sortase n=1 Tax=Dactylosporangium darangshiense TaxID=579108 RepID=UPI003640811D
MDRPAPDRPGHGGRARGCGPTRLRIPALGVDSPLESLLQDAAGVLESPKAYGEAGWFAGGTFPGDPGPAVVAGHVDSKTGPAVFYRLHELKPGDTVDVQRGDGWLTFRVTASEHYAKAQFPSTKVYGPTPVPELRLITCGGEFDQSRHSYRDNLVVYAVLQ